MRIIRYAILLSSALILLALASLWIRGYRVVDEFRWAHVWQLHPQLPKLIVMGPPPETTYSTEDLNICSSRGTVAIQLHLDPSRARALRSENSLDTHSDSYSQSWPPPQSWLGWVVTTPPAPSKGMLGFRIQRIGGSSNNYYQISFPIWMAMILPALVLMLPVIGALRRRRRRKRNLCIHCGYDLRQSADRCPECGNVNSASRPFNARSSRFIATMLLFALAAAGAWRVITWRPIDAVMQRLAEVEGALRVRDANAYRASLSARTIKWVENDERFRDVEDFCSRDMIFTRRMIPFKPIEWHWQADSAQVLLQYNGHPETISFFGPRRRAPEPHIAMAIAHAAAAVRSESPENVYLVHDHDGWKFDRMNVLEPFGHRPAGP